MICGLIYGETNMGDTLILTFNIIFGIFIGFTVLTAIVSDFDVRTKNNILYILKYHFYKRYYKLRYGNQKVPFDKIHIEIQINTTQNLNFFMPALESYKCSGTRLARLYGANLSHDLYCYQIEIRNRKLRYESVSHQDHLLLRIPNLKRNVALHIALDTCWKYDFSYHPWSRNNEIRTDREYAQLVDIHIKKENGEYYFRYFFDPLLYVKVDKELMTTFWHNSLYRGDDHVF